jgi:hypothetical protein
MTIRVARMQSGNHLSPCPGLHPGYGSELR